MATTQINVPLHDGIAALPWQSAHGWDAPKQTLLATDSTRADDAYRATSQGTGLLWHGDYHQARQVLAALKRRLDKKSQSFEALAWPDRFHRIRLQRSQSARQLGLLLVEIKPGYEINLGRAPDRQIAHNAMQIAYGNRLQNEHFVIPLTELTGVLSAYEWHQKGLPIAELGISIHPRWGVFAPTRHEYIGLALQAELPAICQTAVDVGTGTGVLALALARRGVPKIFATDCNQNALDCARDNIARADLQNHIQVLDADFVPEGKFDLLVCNPPWLPGSASGPLEAAIYDPRNQMLRGFLSKARSHLTTNGEAWLILSDLAEHLRLRSRTDLLSWIEQAGLVVRNRLDTRATHPKLQDTKDPLNEARRAETTSLWQLRLASSWA